MMRAHGVRASCLLALCLFAGQACAGEFDYQLKAQPVVDGVWVVPGRNEDFDTVNGGNIVNTAFVVAPQGILLIDSGPSRRYGEQLRRLIAEVSPKPLAVLINTHHHPDHFLGNQAFADVPQAALPETMQGIASEGNAFAENLYRMSGDWMKGTEVRVPSRPLAAGVESLAGERLTLLALQGHTAADLAIYDAARGVLFAGDLVFNGRAPTTPHADIAQWLAALDTLESFTRRPDFKALVPGHGAVTADAAPIRQTRAWLLWLRERIQSAAQQGLEMNEVLALPLPAEFADMPLAASEYRRSVGHLFPAAEAAALGRGKVRQ